MINEDGVASYDTGAGDRIRYTQILGYLNTSLNLNLDNGLIIISTENHSIEKCCTNIIYILTHVTMMAL